MRSDGIMQTSLIWRLSEVLIHRDPPALCTKQVTLPRRGSNRYDPSSGCRLRSLSRCTGHAQRQSCCRSLTIEEECVASLLPPSSIRRSFRGNWFAGVRLKWSLVNFDSVLATHPSYRLTAAQPRAPGLEMTEDRRSCALSFASMARYVCTVDLLSLRHTMLTLQNSRRPRLIVERSRTTSEATSECRSQLMLFLLMHKHSEIRRTGRRKRSGCGRCALPRS